MKLLTTCLAMTLAINSYGADKMAAKNQSLKLDTTKSTATWTGKKVTGSHTGTIQFKDGKFEVKYHTISSGEVTIDMTTIKDKDLTDAEYNKKLVGHLSSPDFFDVAKYPTGTFKITSFTEVKNFVAGQPNAVAKGTLTLHGISQPQEVKLFYTPNDTGFEAKGTLVVDRTAYGLKYNSKKFFDAKALGDKLIDDHFEVALDLVAKK
jgi:polyisoprenoid-binding protein YceI